MSKIIGKKILIIDDEKDILETTESWLRKFGYIVFTALDGEQAIKVLKTETPDLIVVDMAMPVMNGYSFYQKIKGMPECQDIPVIIATARIEMRDVLEAEGASAFLSKPFSLKELLAQIKSLLVD